MLSLFLIFPFAKANETFNRPWLLSGVYVAIVLLLSLIMGLPHSANAWGYLLFDAAIKFVLIGILLKILYHYQDTMFEWFAILFAGVFVIGLVNYLI